MGLLQGKKLLITGVVSKHSIAYQVAKRVQEEGAEIILTGGPGKSCRLTDRVANTLNPVPPVIQMDVTCPEHIDHVANFIQEKWGTFDGFLHAVAYAPPPCLGDNFMGVPWQDVAIALQVSSHSLAAIGTRMAPMMKNGSIIALDFDASKVWAYYNWMGVCKSALESIARYMAKDLGIKHGIRVNCIAAGPIKTVAAKAIPAFESFETMWAERSILEWSVDKGAIDVANSAVFLFSDLSTKITGEILHVDGGFHIMGSPVEQKVQEKIQTILEK